MEYVRGGEDYAISGLRVAYLCGCPDVLNQLRPFTPPWAVGLPAQVAGVRALEDTAYYRTQYEETHRLRDGLATLLRERCGLQVVNGVANFVLAHLRADQPSAAEVLRQCVGHGLFLRDAGAMGAGLGDRAIRIAVKDSNTNQRVVDILEKAVR